MDDPTIFEAWFRPLLQYVKEQDEAGRHPNSITEDEIQEFKKSPSYFIMTINMNGPALGPGTAHKRRMLVSIIIRCFSPAIIFCQELPGYFKKKVAEKCGYRYVNNGKESAVLWQTKAFDGSTEGLKTTDESMRQLRDKVCEVEGARKLLSRIAMVKLTSLKSSDTVLAVSYHGRYKLKKEGKDRDFEILNAFLSEVINKEKGIDSYIIGGDFNFDTLDVKLSKNVVTPTYELSPRQEKASPGRRYISHKDNFVYHPDGKIRVAWTRPFQFEDNASAASDLSKEYHENVKQEMTTGTDSPPNATDMLDHDPIVGVLEFLSQPTDTSTDTDTDRTDTSTDTDTDTDRTDTASGSTPVCTPPYVIGTDDGRGITEWSFARNVSQSTIDGRNSSNACTFIALSFGSIYKQSNLTTPVGQFLDVEWQTALTDAIRTGNKIHDKLYAGKGINVAVDDAIDAVGEDFNCESLNEHNVHGAEPLDQFAVVIGSILQMTQSFHVLVVNDMTLLIIVDTNGI